MRNMTRASKVLLIGVTALVLNACATKPLSPHEAKPVPVERLYLYQTSPNGNYGTLVVTRDSGMMASAAPVKISINGNLAAELNQGETASFMLPEGRLMIGALSELGIFSTGLNEAKDSITAGEEVRYRVGYDPSGTLGLFPTAY